MHFYRETLTLHINGKEIDLEPDTWYWAQVIITILLWPIILLCAYRRKRREVYRALNDIFHEIKQSDGVGKDIARLILLLIWSPVGVIIFAWHFRAPFFETLLVVIERVYDFIFLSKEAKRDKYERLEREELYEEHNAPLIALTSRTWRERSISVGEQNPEQRPGLATQDEKICMLMGLPDQVRLKIWKYVLGGNVFGLYRDNGRLSYSLLDYTNTQNTGLPGRITRELVREKVSRLEDSQWGGSYNHPPCRRKVSRLLSLPRTCRTLYKETINIIYSANIFACLQNCALIDLHRSILPDRLKSIHYIHLHFKIPERKWVHKDQPIPIQTANSLPSPVLESMTLLAYNMPQLDSISIFFQGPMYTCAGSEKVVEYSLANVFNIIRPRFMAVRVPILEILPNPPERKIYVSDRYDIKPYDETIKVEDVPFQVVRPMARPGQDDRELVDLGTINDAGWKVGTMFQELVEGKPGFGETDYTVYTPIGRKGFLWG